MQIVLKELSHNGTFFLTPCTFLNAWDISINYITCFHTIFLLLSRPWFLHSPCGDQRRKYAVHISFPFDLHFALEYYSSQNSSLLCLTGADIQLRRAGRQGGATATVLFVLNTALCSLVRMVALNIKGTTTVHAQDGCTANDIVPLQINSIDKLCMLFLAA